jgi:hypothetical protein
MTMLDDMTEKMRAGRESVGRSLDEMQDQVDAGRLPMAGIIAGAAVLALAFGVGVMVYRRRRRRTLVERLQNALPDSVRDLPSGIKVRVKRAL